MESNDGLWLKTRDDGVLRFKNVALSITETDKEKKDDNTYEHKEENCILELQDEEQPYPINSKYIHTEMAVVCTVTDRTTTEEGKLESFKVRLESLDSEAVINYNSEETKALQAEVPLFVRVVQKSGSKLSIEGSYNLNINFKENLNRVFESVGFKSNKYKVFHNGVLLDKDTKFTDIFQIGKDTYLCAFESMGEPQKWKRFPRVNEYGTWSCSGSPDAINFIAKKPVNVAGFQFFFPKNDDECEMSYKIFIGGNLVEESPIKKYKDREDTYYKTVMLNDTYSANKDARIGIEIKIARNLNDRSNIETYYGSDGDENQSIQGQDNSVFDTEYCDNSNNGTGRSSGQIPTILYFLD